MGLNCKTASLIAKLGFLTQGEIMRKRNSWMKEESRMGWVRLHTREAAVNPDGVASGESNSQERIRIQ